MKIEFIKSTDRFRKGVQVELVNGLANKYISSGHAKPIKFIDVEEIFQKEVKAELKKVKKSKAQE
jgi:hypothetical protein